MKPRRQKRFLMWHFFITVMAIQLIVMLLAYGMIPNYSQARSRPPVKIQDKPLISAVNLSFGQDGKINKIYVQSGDVVKKGQILMELDKSDLTAQLNNIKSNIKLRQSQLENLKAQLKPATNRLNEIKLENAQLVVNNDIDDLVMTIQDAYTKAEDGVRSKSDQLFANPSGYSYSQLNFNIVDSQLQQNLRAKRNIVENTLISWKAALEMLDSGSDLDAYTVSAKNNLRQIKDFLDTAALAVNGTVDMTTSPTMLRNWKLDVSAARSNVNTAFKNILTSLGTLRVAKGNLRLLQEADLALKDSDTSKQIETLSSALTDYQAKEQLLQDKINKAKLISPVDGIVAKQNAKVGMAVSTSSVVISITISK